MDSWLRKIQAIKIENPQWSSWAQKYGTGTSCLFIDQEIELRLEVIPLLKDLLLPAGTLLLKVPKQH